MPSRRARARKRPRPHPRPGHAGRRSDPGLVLAGLALAVILAGGGVFLVMQAQKGFTPTALTPPGQSFSVLPPQAVLAGQAHPAYTSDPPTSGAYQGGMTLEWGVHVRPLPPEQQVTYLVAGGVVIQYQGLQPADIASLEALAAAYPTTVVIAPYNGANPHTVVASAWGHLLELNGVGSGDLEALRKFTDFYHGIPHTS